MPQIVICKATKRIIYTSGAHGKRHDIGFAALRCQLLKDSKVRFKKGTFCLADSGYQGISELHSNALIPHKKPKKKDLTKPQKRYNRMLSSVRVKVENVLSWLKRFGILAERYRNRRKRFSLRFNLIAAIYNLEL